MYLVRQLTAPHGQNHVSDHCIIVKKMVIWFGYRRFKLVDFQRIDWICNPFSTTIKLAGLVEKANIHVGGNLSFINRNKPWVRSRRFR